MKLYEVISHLLQCKTQFQSLISKNSKEIEVLKQRVTKLNNLQQFTDLIDLLQPIIEGDKKYLSKYIDHVYIKSKATIKDIEIRGLGFDVCEIHYQIFEDCKFINLTVADSFLEGCEFVNCDLSHSRFDDTKLSVCKFINCNLTGTYFNDCNLKYSEFLKCNLKEVRFDDSNLKCATIEDCNILRTAFKGVDIYNDGWFDAEAILNDREIWKS